MRNTIHRIRSLWLPALALLMATSANSAMAFCEQEKGEPEELDPLSAAVVDGCCNTVHIYANLHGIVSDAIVNAYGPTIQLYANLGLFPVADALCQAAVTQLMTLADQYCNAIDAVTNACLSVLDAIDAPYDAMCFIQQCSTDAKRRIMYGARSCVAEIECRFEVAPF